MECSNCNAPYAEGQNFCSECGTQLRTPSALTVAAVRQQCQAIIKQELRDQKLVEIEITEAIVGRITNWAKLLGYFAGIPLAILLLMLSALGIKNYVDVSNTATKAERQIETLAANAGKQLGQQTERIANASKQTDVLQGKLNQLGPKILEIESSAAAVAANTQELKDLKGNVTELQKLVGVERWQVKTGQDPDARFVGSIQGAVPATVETLAKQLRPPNIAPAEYQNRRVGPVELTIYRVEAALTAVKLEADGDYHLVLQGNTGATIVAEIPLPEKVFIGNSRWANEIAVARRKVDETASPSAGATHWQGRHVRVTGVGFFDVVHGQMGMAKNGLELHPVIEIEFLP